MSNAALLTLVADLARAVQAGDLEELPVLSDLLQDLNGPGKGALKAWARGRRLYPDQRHPVSKNQAKALRSIILWATDRPAWEAREAQRVARDGNSPYGARRAAVEVLVAGR